MRFFCGCRLFVFGGDKGYGPGDRWLRLLVIIRQREKCFSCLDDVFCRFHCATFDRHLLPGDPHTAAEIKGDDDAKQGPKAARHDLVCARDLQRAYRPVAGRRGQA